MIAGSSRPTLTFAGNLKRKADIRDPLSLAFFRRSDSPRAPGTGVDPLRPLATVRLTAIIFPEPRRVAPSDCGERSRTVHGIHPHMAIRAPPAPVKLLRRIRKSHPSRVGTPYCDTTVALSQKCAAASVESKREEYMADPMHMTPEAKITAHNDHQRRRANFLSKRTAGRPRMRPGMVKIRNSMPAINNKS